MEKCQGDTTNNIFIKNNYTTTRTNVEKRTIYNAFECSNARRNVDIREEKTNTDEHTIARKMSRSLIYQQGIY